MASPKQKDPSQDKSAPFAPLISAAAVVIVLVAAVLLFVVVLNTLDGSDLKSGIVAVAVVIVGVIGLLSVVAVLLVLFRSDPRGRRGGNPTQGDKPAILEPRWFWPLVFAGALLVVNVAVAAVLVLAVNRLDINRFAPEITTAMILIIGVIGLVSVMALLVAVFRHYDPEGRTGALGLPDGSVQAVIALALILIFALFGVYLHGSAGKPDVRRSSCLTAGQVAVIPNGTIVRVQSKRYQRGTKCLKPAPKAKVTKARATTNARARRREARRVRRLNARAARTASRATVVRYTVAVAVPNTERENITTQLLSIIGTLVVAVAGFYFGSKAVQAGVKRAHESVESGAQIARAGVNPRRNGGDEGAQGVTGRPRGPTGDGADEGEDGSLYGSHSPAGLTGADVRDELQSAPLAEEDEAEESLREQGADDTAPAEPDEDEDEEPADEDAEPADEEAEGEDASAYPSTSPVTPGVTVADVQDEMSSSPLAEEDEAEESLDEQGVEDEEPTEPEDEDEEPVEGEDGATAEPEPEDEEPPEEPKPKPKPKRAPKDEPPEKV